MSSLSNLLKLELFNDRREMMGSFQYMESENKWSIFSLFGL